MQTLTSESRTRTPAWMATPALAILVGVSVLGAWLIADGLATRDDAITCSGIAMREGDTCTHTVYKAVTYEALSREGQPHRDTGRLPGPPPQNVESVQVRDLAGMREERASDVRGQILLGSAFLALPLLIAACVSIVVWRRRPYRS